MAWAAVIAVILSQASVWISWGSPVAAFFWVSEKPETAWITGS